MKARFSPEMQIASEGKIGTVVIGVGSSHGDDRAGWEVAEQLTTMFSRTPQVVVHKAAVPHDLLDWLARDTNAYLIDATIDPSAQVQRFEVCVGELGELHFFSNDLVEVRVQRSLPTLRSSSTHQFDLVSTLRLAAILDRLPKTLVLWTIPIVSVAPSSPLESKTQRNIRECVQRIGQELGDA
jgi:hydrogenase maturation protease